MSLTGAYNIMGRLPGVFRDQYQVLEVLGQGATSMAVKARRHDSGREDVIKVLLEGDRDSRARFLLEAKALAAVDHPNVVRLFSSGETQDLLYMVLEFLPGMTLQQRMKGTPIGSADVKQLAIGIASGLEAIHAQDILHRDLKPANIWCLENGTPKLLDFGLARQGEGSGVTQIGTRLGTPGYASPEQIRGETVDSPTDVYSMGLVLYEIVTGAQPSERRPGDSNSIRIRLEKEKGTTLIAGVPGGFVDLVGEMLDPDPGRRPTAEQARVRLQALAWGQPTGPIRACDTERISRPRSRISRRVTMVTGMIAAGLAGVLLTVVAVRWRSRATPDPVTVTAGPGQDPWSSPAPRADAIAAFRELHPKLYAGLAPDKLDGRYWIQMLVNLSRASRVPYRSLNELIGTLEKAATMPAEKIRGTLEKLAAGARETMGDISRTAPELLGAPGTAISRDERWMVFECLVPFLLLDRVLAVQGLADLQVGASAVLDAAAPVKVETADPRGGWKPLRHYLHRPGGKEGGFETINLANAGFMPEERAADQLDPMTGTAITQDVFTNVLDTSLTRHDLSPGLGTPGPVALQLVSWTIWGTPAAFSEQDLLWVSLAGRRPFPLHSALASSFEHPGFLHAEKRPVVLTRGLPRRLLDPGSSWTLRAWREIVGSGIAPFEAQTDLFIGWGRIVEL